MTVRWLVVVAVVAGSASARADDRLQLGVGAGDVQLVDGLVTATRYDGVVPIGTLGYARTRARWLVGGELVVSAGQLTNRYAYRALDVNAALRVAYARRIRPCAEPLRLYVGAELAVGYDIHHFKDQDNDYAHWLTSYGVGPMIAATRPLGRGELHARAGLVLVALASRRTEIPTYQNDRPDLGFLVRHVHAELGPASAWSHRSAHLDLGYDLALGSRVREMLAYRFTYADDTDPYAVRRLSHTLIVAVSYAL